MDMKAKVLIVDDERDFAEALGFLLAHQGFAVDWAFDGDEALVRLKQDKFDYVVTDYKMPSVTGQELFEFAQKELSETPKFIFVSGYIGSIRNQEFDPSIIAIFPKTVHYKSIVDKINQDIEDKKLHATSA